MDMFVAGGGIEGLSCGPGAAVFLDWLKRRSRDVLRTGRESAIAVLAANAVGGFIEVARPVDFTDFCGCVCGCDCEAVWVAGGGSEDESGGLGKLLRAGS